MPSNYRIFLMLLLPGGSLACLPTPFLPLPAVIMAGGLVALLCLAALAAPLLRGRIAVEPTPPSSLDAEISQPQKATQTRVSRSPSNEHNEGSLVDQMLAQGRYALLLRPQI